MCGNIPSCFAPLDDCGDRTNQLHWLKLLHTSYIFLLSQTAKSKVFYSIDKCFETGADPRNIFDKEILKVWMPCLSSFYCVISRATLAWSLNACAIARFSKSARARTKTIGSHLNYDRVTTGQDKGKNQIAIDKPYNTPLNKTNFHSLSSCHIREF